MDWKNLDTEVPQMAERVLVKCADGFLTFGKLTHHGWLDDNSLPIRNVVEWSYVR